MASGVTSYRAPRIAGNPAFARAGVEPRRAAGAATKPNEAVAFWQTPTVVETAWPFSSVSPVG